MKSVFITTMLILVFTSICSGQRLTGTGSYYGNPGFDRGFQATQYCGNNPESWIRGSAWIDKQNGFLTMQIQLETDATHAGPRGQVLCYIYDSFGNILTQVASAEVGIGGKPPGKAVMYTFQATFNCGPDVGYRAAKLVVVPKYTGSSFQFWGVNLEQVKDMMGLIQQFAIFFF
jgi:hypothetical protein